jgi:hypothetical protein
MGYKRTSKKTGANSRRSQTINNTNGSITNSNSTGSKQFRTTYSNNSKTGNKITQTWRDGAGFTHRKTVYSTAGAEQERKRQQKQSAKFWANLFGANKKRRVTKRKPSATSKQQSAQASGSPIVGWIIIGVICWGLYQLIY